MNLIGHSYFTTVLCMSWNYNGDYTLDQSPRYNNVITLYFTQNILIQRITPPKMPKSIAHPGPDLSPFYFAHEKEQKNFADPEALQLFQSAFANTFEGVIKALNRQISGTYKAPHIKPEV